MNTDVHIKEIGKQLKVAGVQKNLEEMKWEQWQRWLLTQRWDDEAVGKVCFAWMTDWNTAATHIIAGMNELYQQMLPMKVYHKSKTRLEKGQNVLCQMCGKALETQAHVQYLQVAVTKKGSCNASCFWCIRMCTQRRGQEEWLEAIIIGIKEDFLIMLV